MSVVVEPSLQIGSWISSGLDAYGVRWRNATFTGLFDTPPVRQAFPVRAGATGAIPQRGFDGPRIIVWTGSAIAPDQATAEAAKARFRAASVNRDPTTGEDLGVDVTLTKIDGTFVFHGKRSDIWSTGPLGGPETFAYQATLTCEDPRIYGGTLRSLSASLVNTGTGTGQLLFPFSFPFDFGGTAAGVGTMVTTNLGTEITYPTITVTGPGTNLRLDDQSSGSYLIITSLGTGEFVTLDCRLRRVLFMGYAPRRQLLGAGSEWFGIAPGTDSIVFGASSYTTASVLVQWRDAY